MKRADDTARTESHRTPRRGHLAFLAFVLPAALLLSGCVVVHRRPPRKKAVVVKPRPVKVVHVHTAHCHH